MLRPRPLAMLSCGCLLLLSLLLQAGEPFRYTEKRHGKGELKYVNGFPVLVLDGTPEEIGAQMAVLVGPAASGLMTYFKRLLKEFHLEPAMPWLVKSAQGMLKQFPPDHLRELQAAQKAFGPTTELADLLLVGNCLWDIKKLGCSTIIVEPGRSATQAPLFGRNLDFPTLGTLHEFSLVIVCRPAGKHSFVSIGFPGLLGCLTAINDAGLAVATLDVTETNDGSPPFDLSGTPLSLTFRRMMEECTTIAEAEKLLRASKRTTLLNLAVCDKKGGAVFEITPKNVVVRRAVESLCCCTNHFRTKELATSMECRRYSILDGSRELPQLGIADVAQKLHAANQGEATFQTMVFEPAALRLHLALGKGPSSALPLRPLDLTSLLRPAGAPPKSGGGPR